MLFLSDILHEMHWIVVVVGCLLCIAAALGNRKQNAVLLVLYLACVVYMTLAGERGGRPGVSLDLFWSYRRFFTNTILREQIINNIWLFVPLGAILYRLWPRGYVVLIPSLLSLAIEVMQLVLRTGLFEFDDIVSNSPGGLIGVLVCWGIRKGMAALSA